MNIPHVIDEVASLSRSVGKFILEERSGFSQEKVEFKKSSSDLVSYVDKTAEEKLVAGLKDLIPKAGFLTEESTVEQKKEEYTWIIDPLDGTTNFVHGIPVFAVSVGLLHHEKVVGGVVYEINRDECFYASEGNGAFLNGAPINVSRAETIEESLFSTGFPYYNFEKLEEYLAILNQLMKNSHGLRRMGSAATDLAYVACGRFEAFFEYNLNPWDVAAGIIIIQEAGGEVTDFKGGDDFLFGREIVAGGPVQKELLSIIQNFW